MVNLQPHKLSCEQFHVVPVTEAEAIKLMEEAANAREAEVNEARRRMREMEAEEARERAAKAEEARRQAAVDEARRRMREMEAEEARQRAARAAPAFMSCPSRPVTSTKFGPREAWDYNTACYQVRRAIEDAVGTPTRVKHHIKDLGASKEDTAWGIDLHDYLCLVVHTGWDKKGDTKWFEQMMLRLKHVFNLEPVITRPL
jgi:hypothetical protein